MGLVLHQYSPGGVAKQITDAIGALESSGFPGVNPSFLLLSGNTRLDDSYSGFVVSYAGSNDITVTIPAGLTPTFNCAFIQEGAGKITISPESGAVTVNNSHDLFTTFGLYSAIGVICVSPDSYIVTGEVG